MVEMDKNEGNNGRNNGRDGQETMALDRDPNSPTTFARVSPIDKQWSSVRMKIRRSMTTVKVEDGGRRWREYNLEGQKRELRHIRDERCREG
ncbi:hypothetical protein U1Q18_002874 [Sarracenia purpurea var. burkii]